MLYFYYHIPAVLEYKSLISYALLSLAGFVTAAFRKPYTMYNARAAYDEGFGESSLFVEVNILITRIWAGIYLLNTLLFTFVVNRPVAIIAANALVVMGIVCSIIIPDAMPESS
jgi:hypothetical protein